MNRWEGILNFMYCRLQRLFKYNLSIFFFFNDTATTEIYTLSLHDALPISFHQFTGEITLVANVFLAFPALHAIERSEEHTSELQSRLHLVCRLLLEKKKKSAC